MNYKGVIYEAVDVLTLGRGVPRRVGGEVVRFPPRWCRYYPADYEPATFAFLRSRCRSGQTVLDIGAHIGLFTVALARLVGPGGRVYSFEPTPGTRAVLEATVRLNACEPIVEVRPEAVSRTSGTAEFAVGDQAGCNANSLVDAGRRGGALTVPTVCVDDFATALGLTVGCLKIDAEGAELEVLLGARRVFAEHRPAAWLALHPDAIVRSGATLSRIWEVFQDYRLSAVSEGRPVDADWFVAQRNLFDVGLLPLP